MHVNHCFSMKYYDSIGACMYICLVKLGSFESNSELKPGQVNPCSYQLNPHNYLHQMGWVIVDSDCRVKSSKEPGFVILSNIAVRRILVSVLLESID